MYKLGSAAVRPSIARQPLREGNPFLRQFSLNDAFPQIKTIKGKELMEVAWKTRDRDSSRGFDLSVD